MIDHRGNGIERFQMRWLFVNTQYKGNDLPLAVRNILDYINSGKINDSLTERIHNKVIEVNTDPEVQNQIMREIDIRRYEREEGAMQNALQTIERMMPSNQNDLNTVLSLLGYNEEEKKYWRDAYLNHHPKMAE